MKPLYRLSNKAESACSNVQNPNALKGKAGTDSRFPRLQPGDRVIIADLKGPGLITRLWLTVDWPGKDPYPNSMIRNRSLRLLITWDNADTPAVDVPLGDFFCHPLCYDIPFENGLFADPTGRSSLCTIQMPFNERAEFTIINEFDQPVTVFHDIRFLRNIEPHPDNAYFHACFNRTIPSSAGQVHNILPKIEGRGRYLGTHFGIITDPQNPLHWSMARPSFFIDGDTEHPTIMGASIDDFAGASWDDEMPYMQSDSGLIVSREFDDGTRHMGMYVYHQKDPLYFQNDCAASITPIVGNTGEGLLKQLTEHPHLEDRMSLPCTREELEKQVAAAECDWIECARLDDYTSVALYYLDSPKGNHTLTTNAARCTPASNWPNADILYCM